MFSKVKKIVGGVVIVFVVLALIGACLGEDEGDSEYLAWLEKKCPNYIFEKVERFEGRAVDRDDKDEIRSVCIVFGFPEKCKEMVINSLASPKSEFDDTIKVTQIVRTYKVKDEYKPESEWGYRQFTEFVFSVLSMPKGIERMHITQGTEAMSISDEGVWKRVTYRTLYALQNKEVENRLTTPDGRYYSFDLSNKETVRLVSGDKERIALLFVRLSRHKPVYIYFAKK